METRNGRPNSRSCHTQDGTGNCEECPHIKIFGRIKYCAFCPANCGLHQIIKTSVDPANSKRRCVFCKHYTLGLKSKKCEECLSTLHLDGFVVADDIKSADWYRNYEL